MRAQHVVSYHQILVPWVSASHPIFDLFKAYYILKWLSQSNFIFAISKEKIELSTIVCLTCYYVHWVKTSGTFGTRIPRAPTDNISNFLVQPLAAGFWPVLCRPVEIQILDSHCSLILSKLQNQFRLYQTFIHSLYDKIYLYYIILFQAVLQGT